MTFVAVNAAGASMAPGTGMPEPLPPGAPVTVLIHGFRYDPARADCCPHRLILSPVPVRGDRRIVSWPRRLGFGRGAPGVGVGFGWRGAGSIWDAYAEAGRAGQAMANLVAELRARGAGPVNLVAHSLGARVALAALGGLAPGDIGRVVLMAAAEFRAPAAAALDTPAGRATEILNVASRANAAFDLMFEAAFAGCRGRALGIDGLQAARGVTLDIDAEPHRQALAALGYPLAPPAARICHWSAYLRPGLFPLYRSFLFHPRRLPLDLLRAALPPADLRRRRPMVPPAAPMPPAPLPPGPIAAH